MHYSKCRHKDMEIRFSPHLMSTYNIFNMLLSR